MKYVLFLLLIPPLVGCNRQSMSETERLHFEKEWLGLDQSKAEVAEAFTQVRATAGDPSQVYEELSSGRQVSSQALEALGPSLLILAIERSDMVMLRQLLQLEIDPFEKDFRGIQPVAYAAFLDNLPAFLEMAAWAKSDTFQRCHLEEVIRYRSDDSSFGALLERFHTDCADSEDRGPRLIHEATPSGPRPHLE